MEAAPRPTDEQMPGAGGVVTMAREAEPSAPQNLAPGPTSEGLKAQTEVGKVRNGRKDIPAKKDRLEPLKIDMSKHFLIPPTSAQLSLQCLECHIIFSDHKSKERHLKQSHPAEYEQCMLGDALFACYVCDRHFACSTELMVHQRAHTEKQPFKCPICGEAFCRSSELTIHKKVHYGLHGYTCLECGKPCKTLTLLKYHRRTHTGERPYVCKDCGKRFSMSKALQKHLLTHVKEEDMEARGGGTILLTPTGDATHIKKLGVSSQGKPAITFSCSLCDGIFKTAKTRLQHMKLKHAQGRGTAQNLITVKGEHRKEGQSMKAHTEIPPEQTLQHLQTFVQGQALQQMETLGQEQMQELISTFGNEQVKDKVEVMGHEQLQVQMDTREQEQAERPINKIVWPQGQTETLGQEQTSIQLEPLGLEQAQRQTETLGLEQTQRQTETLGLEQTQRQTETLGLEQAQRRTETFGLEQAQRQTETLGLEQTQRQMETVGLLQIQRQIEILEPEQTQRQREIIELEQTQLQTETLELDLIQGQMETVVLEQTQRHVEMMQLENSGQLKTVEIGQTHVELDALAVEQTHSTMENVESELTQVQMDTVELELTQVETVELELTEVQVGTMELDLTQIQVDSAEFELTQVQVQTAELSQTQKQSESWEQMETQPPKESDEGVAQEQTGAEENKKTYQKPVPAQQLSENTLGQTEQTSTQMQRHTLTPCLSLLQANEPEQDTSQLQGIQLHTLNLQYLPKHSETAQIQPLQESLIAAHTLTQTFLKGFPQAQSMKMTPEGKSAKHSQSLVLEREFPGHAQPEKESKLHSETQLKVKRTKRSRSKKERLAVRFVAPEKVKQSAKQKPLQTHQTHLKDGYKKQKTQVKPQLAQLQPKVVKEKKRKKKEKCEKTVTAQTLLQDKMVHQPVEKIQQVTVQTQPAQVKKKKEQTQKSATAQKQPEKMKEQLSLQMPKKKKKISQKGKLKNEERMPPEKKQKKKQEKNKKQNHIPENQEQIKQQSLLLLKGHKQPQLKVHKLDPSKTQQQPQQLLPCKSQTQKPQQDPQMLPVQKQQKLKKTQQKKKPNQKPQRQPKTKPKEKQQQAVLLLPLLLPPPLSSPLKVKPMTNRKRKASKVRVAETDLGSPQARRALACQDCGERFSEVLALEEHTAAVHALVIRPNKFNSDSSVFTDISRTDGETSLGLSAKRLTQETLDHGQNFTSLHELGVGKTHTLLNPRAGTLQNHEGDRVKVAGAAALGGELNLTLNLIPTPKASEGTLGNTIHTDNFGMQVATDWDMEVEMGEIGLGDRVERVSFPALNPSPSLSFAAACLEGEGKGGVANWDSVVGTVPRVTSDFSVSASGHSQELKTQQREEFDDIVKCSKNCPEETTQGGAPSGVPLIEDTPLDAAPSSPPSICVLSPSLCDYSHATPLDTLNHNQSLNLSPATQLQDFTQLETAKTKGKMEGREFEEKNEDKEEPSSGLQLITSCQEPQSATEEEIKEELLLEVDIVTIGDQNMEDNTLCQDSSHVSDDVPHAYHTATCQLQIETTQSCQHITADTPTLATQVKNQDSNANVSMAAIHSKTHASFCSKDCSEIKQEEVEEEVESREGGRRRIEGDSTGRSCRRRGHGGDQRGGRKRVEADVMKETELEAEGCQVILQLQSLTSASPVKEEDGVELFHRSKSPLLHQQENTKPRCEQGELSGACIPESCLPASLEESSDEQIVFELESVTTSVGVLKTEDGMETEGAGEQITGAGDCHSPSILLERFLTGRERSEGDVEQSQNKLRINNRPQVDRTSSGFSIEAIPQNDGGRMTLMGSVMGQVIKVENYSSNLISCPNGPSATPGRDGAVVISQVDPCEEQHGVRVFLVKEEDPLILDEPQAFLGHRQSEFPGDEMRVEGNTCADSEAASLEDREGGGEGVMEEAASVSPLMLGVGVRGNEQCIFFRMKEEENEVALEPPQREHGLSVLLVSRTAGLGQQANPSHTDAEGPLMSDLHSGLFTDSSGIWVSVPPGCGAEQGVAEIEDCEQDTERSIQMGTQQNVYLCTGEGELNAEQQSSEELLEFFQQKSDAEHSDSSESEPEGEAYAMACYHGSGSCGSMSTNEISSKKRGCSTLNIPVQGRSGDSVTEGRGEGGGNGGQTPIEYFSQYLDWETWEEIAHCTSTMFGTPNSVIAKEVAQFVGIHIAMGTLKFPDKKLYWQDFTRVPLIADAMPASRFAQLAHKLRLAHQPEDSELPMGTGKDGGSACGYRGVASTEGPENQLNTGHCVDPEGPVSTAHTDEPDISRETRKTDTVSHRDAATHRLEDGVMEQTPGDPRHNSQQCNMAGVMQTSAHLLAGSARAEHTHNTRSRTHYSRKRVREASDVQTLGNKSRMQAVSNAHSNAQRSEGGHSGESTCTVNIDPLWQVRGVLDRVRSGCLLLSHEGNYGMDQHPLDLGRCRRRKSLKNSRPALQCAVLLGAGGLVLDLNLSLNDSGREDTLQKIIPRNKKNGEGLVFLCKEELCTPAVLERLLVSGVRSAGRVGGVRGVRGGVGDEFVSSDGRLTLLRCQQGFILSTLTKRQAHQVSLAKDFEGAQKDAQLNRDLLNLYSTPLSASSPTRWPQSVLWHLTDLALVNSWLQFRQDRGHSRESPNLMAFRLEVAKALIHTNGSNMPHSAPPHPPAPKLLGQDRAPSPVPLTAAPLPDTAIRYDSLGHWPEQLAEGEGARCRFGGCERTSRVRCLKCCVFLCISQNHNCFLKFHSQGSI